MSFIVAVVPEHTGAVSRFSALPSSFSVRKGLESDLSWGWGGKSTKIHIRFPLRACSFLKEPERLFYCISLRMCGCACERPSQCLCASACQGRILDEREHTVRTRQLREASVETHQWHMMSL